MKDRRAFIEAAISQMTKEAESKRGSTQKTKRQGPRSVKESMLGNNTNVEGITTAFGKSRKKSAVKVKRINEKGQKKPADN